MGRFLLHMTVKASCSLFEDERIAVVQYFVSEVDLDDTPSQVAYIIKVCSIYDDEVQQSHCTM